MEREKNVFISVGRELVRNSGRKRGCQMAMLYAYLPRSIESTKIIEFLVGQDFAVGLSKKLVFRQKYNSLYRCGNAEVERNHCTGGWTQSNRSFYG